MFIDTSNKLSVRLLSMAFVLLNLNFAVAAILTSCSGFNKSTIVESVKFWFFYPATASIISFCFFLIISINPCSLFSIASCNARS